MTDVSSSYAAVTEMAMERDDALTEMDTAHAERNVAIAQRDDLADQLAKATSENTAITVALFKANQRVATLADENAALRASLKRADQTALNLAAQVDEQADQIETGTADRAAAAAKAADIVHRDKDGYYNVDDLIAIATYIEKGKP